MTDMQAIIKGVLNLSPHYWPTTKGDVEISCNFCKRKVFRENVNSPFKMSDIAHSEDCAWKIAEKLNKGERL